MKLNLNSEKPMDIVAIGRLCIDLNANEIHRPMEESITFTKYVGGSPANIAVGCARLGLNTGFIGKVSDDQMGRYIVDYLKKNNVETSSVVSEKGTVTGLTFTEIKSPTECSILMYREQVADLKLQPEEVSESYIKNTKMLLISGTALSKSPSREAIFIALHYAKKHAVPVFFDLDYRPYTWLSLDEVAIYYQLVAEKSDCIIGTKEEFSLLNRFEGEIEEREGCIKWFHHQTKIVVMKHGENGSIAYTKEGKRILGKVFPSKVVKTFGAGDAYASSFLYGLCRGLSIEKAMNYGSAAASIVISSHSCSDAMPTVDEVEKYIEKHTNGG